MKAVRGTVELNVDRFEWKRDIDKDHSHMLMGISPIERISMATLGLVHGTTWNSHVLVKHPFFLSNHFFLTQYHFHLNRTTRATNNSMATKLSQLGYIHCYCKCQFQQTRETHNNSNRVVVENVTNKHVQCICTAPPNGISMNRARFPLSFYRFVAEIKSIYVFVMCSVYSSCVHGSWVHSTMTVSTNWWFFGKD